MSSPQACIFVFFSSTFSFLFCSTHLPYLPVFLPEEYLGGMGEKTFPLDTCSYYAHTLPFFGVWGVCQFGGALESSSTGE